MKAKSESSAESLEAAKAQARAVQAACARKDEMLRELRDRMEQLMHGSAAHTLAQQDEEADVGGHGHSGAEPPSSELRRLEAELARRDGLLESARADAAQV